MVFMKVQGWPKCSPYILKIDVSCSFIECFDFHIFLGDIDLFLLRVPASGCAMFLLFFIYYSGFIQVLLILFFESGSFRLFFKNTVKNAKLTI